MRVAIGEDSHRIDYDNKKKKLILGGVIFDEDFSLIGNSDSDVIYHSLTNAVSGITTVNILGKEADLMCNSGITANTGEELTDMGKGEGIKVTTIIVTE